MHVKILVGPWPREAVCCLYAMSSVCIARPSVATAEEQVVSSMVVVDKPIYDCVNLTILYDR